jgi:hypothetical protein
MMAKHSSVHHSFLFSFFFSSPRLRVDAVEGDKQGWEALEDAHTHTLFYAAQCYGHLGKPDLSAEFVFRTLSRQLASQRYKGQVRTQVTI